MAEHDSTSSDAFSSYGNGLRLLLDKLGRDHPRYATALTYQQRLLESIVQSRQYGDTETRRAERSEIIHGLNELTSAVLGLSFNQPCDQAPSYSTQGDEPSAVRECKPRIFLSHASEDKPQVKELYCKLQGAGYDPWLDEEDLMPGQDWKQEIKKIISDPTTLLWFAFPTTR